MKLYRIRDWQEHYENHKTRLLKKLDWVAIPNRQDGDGYTTMVTYPNGPAIFGAFIVLVQVASRCVPRGVLLRDNGQPHDAESLARMTRFPVELIHQTLELLSTPPHNWIEFSMFPMVAVDPADKAAVDPAAIVATKEGKKEGNEGKERNGGALECFAVLRGKLNGLYGRDDLDHWGNSEEQMLLIVAGRANALVELDTLAAWRARMPSKERQYFPNSVYKLLDGWEGCLDRARANNAPTPRLDREAMRSTKEAENL